MSGSSRVATRVQARGIRDTRTNPRWILEELEQIRDSGDGDVQLARRFDEFLLKRWSADAEFEALVESILRNLPLREPSALSARSLRRLLQVADGLTSRAFRALHELAVEAIEGRYGHDDLAPGTAEAHAALEAFVGSADSGDPDWAGRDVRELRSEDPATRR